MKKFIASITILGVFASFGINNISVNASEIDPPISWSPKVAIWLPDVPPAEINVG